MEKVLLRSPKKYRCLSEVSVLNLGAILLDSNLLAGLFLVRLGPLGIAVSRDMGPLSPFLWDPPKNDNTKVTFGLARCFFATDPPIRVRLAFISEEDKRATTNVQNGLVLFFLFSFIVFFLSLN